MASDGLLLYVGLAIYMFEREPVLDLAELLSDLRCVCPSFELVSVQYRTPEDAGRARVPASISVAGLAVKLACREVRDFVVLDSTASASATVRLQISLGGRGRHPDALKLRLPLSLFEGDKAAAERLVAFAGKMFPALSASYAYGGLAVTATAAKGANQNLRGMDSIRATDLADVNIETEFATKAKGAFWLNILGAEHVSALGGQAAVALGAPVESVEVLRRGGMLLRLRSQPFSENGEDETARYSRLEEYLAPIVISDPLRRRSVFRERRLH